MTFQPEDNKAQTQLDPVDQEIDASVSAGAYDKNVEAGPSVVQHDAVFGEITEDGPNYRNVRFFSHLCPL